jgi:hypothetical protein
MSVCMCVYVCACVHMCMSVCMCVYVCMCIYVSMCVCVCVCVFVYACVFIPEPFWVEESVSLAEGISPQGERICDYLSPPPMVFFVGHSKCKTHTAWKLLPLLPVLGRDILDRCVWELGLHCMAWMSSRHVREGLNETVTDQVNFHGLSTPQTADPAPPSSYSHNPSSQAPHCLRNPAWLPSMTRDEGL